MWIHEEATNDFFRKLKGLCEKRRKKKEKKERTKVPRISIRPASRQADGSIVKGQTKQCYMDATYRLWSA